MTGGDRSASERRRAPSAPIRTVPVLSALAVLIVLGNSVWSGVTYTQLWARSPARSFVTTLVKELESGHATKALYDSPVPQKILPLTPAGISAIVGLTDAHADFGYAAARPGFVDDTGRIRPAKLYPQSSVEFTDHAFCHFPVQGATVISRSLRRPVHTGDWYLDVGYFQQYASVVTFTMVDVDGTRHSASNGNPQVLHAGLGEIHLHFPGSAPAAVRVQSTSPATNLCLTSLRVGFAYAAVPAK